jgi:hypothetical protein
VPSRSLPHTSTGSAPERRSVDRRRQVVHALLVGSFRRRRRGPRRAGEGTLSGVDWHHPHWLAIAIFIVLLSGGDALLTLMLVERGASEANPLMAPLVGSPLAFAVTKMAITGAGVILLTQMARVRAFGRVPVGAFLYSALLIYGALVVYEMHLLNGM